MEAFLKVVETNGLAVAISVFFLYILFRAANLVLDRFARNGKKDKHANLIDLRKQIGTDIENLLNSALIQAGASRAYVFEYHNGTESLGGLPFLKMSNTYEVVGCGVRPQQSTLMDMSCLLYQKFIRALDVNPYLVLNVDDRKDEFGHLTYETLVEQGVKCAILVKFTDRKNRTAGYVGIDYDDCHPTKNVKEVSGIARDLAAKVGVLLAIV